MPCAPGAAQGPGPVTAAEDADGALPFWATLVFLFVLLIAPQSFVPVLAKLRIALLSGGLAIAACILARVLHRRPLAGLTPELRLALLLAGWALVTAPLSVWPGGSVAFLWEVYFKTLVVFWLLANVVSTQARLQMVAWALSLIAAPLALTGVANFMDAGASSAAAAPGVVRIDGYNAPLTGNPNDLALMLNLILPLTIALLAGSKRPATRVLLFALLCMDVMAIIATFSRAGFLTLAVTALAYLWLLVRHRRWQHVILACALVVAASPFLPSSYVERIGTITDIEADPTGSAQARWGDTVAALKYVLRSPVIGSGIGMNTLALNEIRGPAWKEIHNVYLEYAVELGIPGIVLFVMLMARCIRGVAAVERACMQQPRLDQLGRLAAGIRISLIGFAVSAMFYPVAYHFYFYCFAGLAVAATVIFGATGGAAGRAA